MVVHNQSVILWFSFSSFLGFSKAPSQLELCHRSSPWPTLRLLFAALSLYFITNDVDLLQIGWSGTKKLLHVKRLTRWSRNCYFQPQPTSMFYLRYSITPSTWRFQPRASALQSWPKLPNSNTTICFLATSKEPGYQDWCMSMNQSRKEAQRKGSDKSIFCLFLHNLCLCFKRNYRTLMEKTFVSYLHYWMQKTSNSSMDMLLNSRPWIHE